MDLHHKMSKKIAQLTRVIYHLNTRNDDHDLELSALTKQHEVSSGCYAVARAGRVCRRCGEGCV